MKAPQLRFKGFKDEWEKNQFDEVFQVVDGDRGKNYPNSNDFIAEGFCLFLNAKNVTLNRFSFNETLFISEEKDLSMSKGKLQRNDIILTSRGTVGNIAYYSADIPYKHMRINSGMLILRSIKNYPEYNYIFLKSNLFRREVKYTIFGSAQPQLTVKDVKKMKISYPNTKGEQQKIASFFSLLDQKIEKQQEKIEQIELFKKGLMQKIFSQEIRFKDEDGGEFPEWKEKKLGEIATFLKGNSISKSNLSEDGHPCVLYGEIYTKYSEVILKVVSRTNLVSDKLIKGYKNDVLIPSSGETAIDIACATALEVNDVYLGGDINIIRPKDGVNGTFISYELNHARKKALVRVAQGATVVHLYNTSLKSILILLPQKEEQQKIASFLTSIDKKIEKEKEKLEALQQQKKAFLQQMFI